jgi:glycosyltransferase involved in cell wall biosynthesis
MSRTVLLITRAFYPSNAPGSHRPAKAAKYLLELGWTPVVLCADWTRAEHPAHFDTGLAVEDDVCRTIRIPYPPPRLGRFGRAFRRAAVAAFPYSTPRSALRTFTREAMRLVESSPIDLVWSTYLPGFTHAVASAVSARAGVPWVADFRDLPDQEGESWVSRRSVTCEIDVCRRASAFTTTSGTLARLIESRHDVPVRVVLNGYDPDDYAPGVEPSSDRFEITHYGTLYAHRDPRPFLRALDLLDARGEIDFERVTVEFHGPPARQIRELAQGFRCARIIKARGRIPYKAMLRRQQESSLLLLLKSARAGGSIPSKLFDYLGARRPVLNVPGDEGEVDSILSDTQGGLSAGDPGEIAAVLGAWYREWRASGPPKCASDPEKLARYSRREQTRRLAGVFESVLGEGGTARGRPAGEPGDGRP